MTQSVAELHAAYPYDRDERWWPYPESFAHAASAAGELHAQEDPFTYLETLQSRDEERARAIGHSLLYLPADVVIDSFGDKVAAWTAINTSLQGEDDHVKEALQARAGYDLTDFGIAQNWSWQHNYKRSATDVLAQYNLMQGLKGGLLDEVDLPGILMESTKEGVELTEQRLGHYALIPIETDDYNNYYSGGHVKGWSRDVSPTLAYNMWLDSPSGFALTYKGLPNAMAGLAMVGSDEVMLYQLQGVRGQRVDPTKSRYDEEHYKESVSSRGLAPLDWAKVMTSVTERIAENMSLNSVAIQAAKNNVWIKKRMPRDTEPHLPIEAARKVYDDNAARLGYEEQEDDEYGNWHKTVALAGSRQQSAA